MKNTTNIPCPSWCDTTLHSDLDPVNAGFCVSEREDLSSAMDMSIGNGTAFGFINRTTSAGVEKVYLDITIEGELFPHEIEQAARNLESLAQAVRDYAETNGVNNV